MVHDLYGTLFCALVDGLGTVISEQDEDGKDLPYMTTAEILVQLEKLGFDISYKEEIHLPSDQLTFLNNLMELGFDTLSRIFVQTEKMKRNYVVASNSLKRQEYCNFGSIHSKKFFDTSLEEGWAANISKVGKHLSWDWLTYTVKIRDLLEANSKVAGLVIPDIIPHPLPESPVPGTVVPDNLTPYTETSEEEQEQSTPVFPSFGDTSQFHIYGEVVTAEEDEESSGGM